MSVAYDIEQCAPHIFSLQSFLSRDTSKPEHMIHTGAIPTYCITSLLKVTIFLVTANLLIFIFFSLLLIDSSLKKKAAA